MGAARPGRGARAGPHRRPPPAGSGPDAGTAPAGQAPHGGAAAPQALADRLPAGGHSRPRPGQRNLIHWAFLDPEAREKYVDWEKVASSMAGTLRLDAGRHPDDPQLAQLVGRIDVHYEALEVTGAEDQTLFLYSTEKGSDSEARLRTLASWLAENQPGPGSMPISESMS
ncbi:hypothetical protein [Kocuria palustris]|uniref:MmyB family transcriptional regulator n=1 Tax=Kocuria palustris TaxID=71999 RepID=UPI00246876B6|nr:hypothetical protein [Kocuria palustris]MDH5150674.1 hypothetical protein [Kocuria palustris]